MVDLQQKSAAWFVYSSFQCEAVCLFIHHSSLIGMAASPRWWTKDTVVVVTGSNKGIGFTTVKLLAQEGLTVVLTARDPERGLEAVNKLKEEGLKNIDFHVLDVRSSDSVSALATWLKESYGGIDILINNAAIAGGSEESCEAAKNTIDTNYRGVKRVTEGLLSILKASSAAGARIVNVSSSLGQLQNLRHPTWREELLDADNLSEEKVEAFLQAYLEDVKQGTNHTWTTQYTHYSVAKMAMNAYSRLLARSLEQNRVNGQKICVNFVCPGFTKTDLNNNTGILTVEEGADTVVWTALLPPGGPSGLFFCKRQPIAF